MFTDKKTVAIRVFSSVAAVFLFFSLAASAFAADRTVYASASFSVGHGEKTGIKTEFVLSPLEHFADGKDAELPLFVAARLKEASPDLTLTRLYGVTPVIFVKKGVYAGSVSWHEAFSGRHRIMLPADTERSALVMLSAAFAMSGSAAKTEKAVQKLSDMSKNGIIAKNASDADLILDLDFVSYPGFVPVVPEDGTVSFTQCFVSRSDFTVTDDDREHFARSGVETARKESGGAVIPDFSLGDDIASAYSNVLSQMRFIVNGHIRSALGKNGYTVFTVISLFLLILWCGAIARRSMQKTFSRSVVLTGVLIAFWITVRFIKWQTDDAYTVSRYMWYSFYVFFIFLPLLVLLTAAKVGVREDDGRPPRFWWGFFAAGTVLLVFVLTNDIHHAVFGFSGSPGDYTYAPGYFVVVLFIAATFVTALSMLYAKCIKSTYKPSIFYPVVLSGVPLVFWILFVRGVKFAASTDITLASSVFSVFIYDAVLRTGLVPCNVKYRKLFRISRLGMQIVGFDGKTEYSSARVRRLSRGDFEAMLGGERSRASEYDRNIIISRSDIPGGFVIRQEDISLLAEDEKKLKRSVRALTDANSVLEKRERVAAERESENAKKRLYAELDEKLREKLESVRSLAANLPDGITDENADEYRLLVAAVGFNLCYIKRRCSFLFKRMRGDPLPADDIVTCVSELCEFAGNMGVKCVPYQSIDGLTAPSDCETVYDFCFSVLEFAAEHECSDVILRFFRDGGDTVMSIIGDETFASCSVPEKLCSENAETVKKDLGGACSVTLTVHACSIGATVGAVGDKTEVKP